MGVPLREVWFVLQHVSSRDCCESVHDSLVTSSIYFTFYHSDVSVNLSLLALHRQGCSQNASHQNERIHRFFVLLGSS